MWITLKILALLWAINLTPPLLSLLLKEHGQTPVDLGRRLKDGQPLFGPHKTIRGLLGGILAGGMIAKLMGFPLAIGLGCGALSMIGDLASSLIKRRLWPTEWFSGCRPGSTARGRGSALSTGTGRQYGYRSIDSHHIVVLFRCIRRLILF